MSRYEDWFEKVGVYVGNQGNPVLKKFTGRLMSQVIKKANSGDIEIVRLYMTPREDWVYHKVTVQPYHYPELLEMLGDNKEMEISRDRLIDPDTDRPYDGILCFRVGSQLEFRDANPGLVSEIATKHYRLDFFDKKFNEVKEIDLDEE